ncbi:hypothetical protein PVK06_026638 [Gossypium arboreum]|uniref:Uncharacterized protein n=1 Tax=Gossypium arboreum TaxID=29729 RepID=A0ABR0NYA8_GOSAR|nr:hypothetical protein PVK06_026638 [Gossypium arboreum]
MNWLKDNFNELFGDPEDRRKEVIQQYTRAYIMMLIGGILIPEKSQNLVYETKLGIYHIVHVISGDVLGHTTECGVDRWLSAPIAVVSLVATTVSMSQGGQPIYVPFGDKVELRGTDQGSRRYYKSSYVGLTKDLEDIRLLLDQRSEAAVSYCFEPILITSVGQSKDVGCEGVVGNVRDCENARIRLSVAAVRVEATNSTVSARPERATEGGHAGEGQHRLGSSTRGAYRSHFTLGIPIQLSKPAFCSQAPLHYGPLYHVAGSSVPTTMYSRNDDDEEEVYKPAPSDATSDAPLMVRSIAESFNYRPEQLRATDAANTFRMARCCQFGLEACSAEMPLCISQRSKRIDETLFSRGPIDRLNTLGAF